MGASVPVITGIGTICALGSVMEEIIAGILERKACSEKLPFASDILAHRRIAPVRNFDAGAYVADSKSLRYMSRETHLAVSALTLCMKDSRIVVNETYPDDCISLFAGTGSSGMDLRDIENMLDNSVNDQTGLFDPVRFGAVGLNRLNPLTSFKILPNMSPAVAAINLGIKGNNLIFNPWEGSALLALLEAFEGIRLGREQVVFCGGSDCKTHSDAFLTLMEYGLFENSDIVLSEGSSYLCLEDIDSARKRHASVYCAIRGITHISHQVGEPGNYPFSGDLYDDCMKQALQSCDLHAADIDLIISSNDLNFRNDDLENKSIQSIFGDCPVLSSKTIIGNAVAAAGYINVAIGAAILFKGISIGGRKVNSIIVNSFSMGSELFCLVLEKI